MNTATAILRWLFGIFYAYIGGSWFVHLIIAKPWVTPLGPVRANALTSTLTSSGIVYPLIAATCLSGGLLLLFRRTSPLGIVILAPLVFGIFVFHLFLTGAWVWGSMNLGLLVVLMWLHRNAFRPLWSYEMTHAF